MNMDADKNISVTGDLPPQQEPDTVPQSKHDQNTAVADGLPQAQPEGDLHQADAGPVISKSDDVLQQQEEGTPQKGNAGQAILATDALPQLQDDGTLHEANQEISAAYDRQVYTSNAFPFCSPLHLRAAAHVYGLDSVPVERARVLELGCAGGGNLLPFALAYPDAHVVGVDLSAVQVSQGQDLIHALGIENLQLHAMSLTDIDADFGQFDYIIAHGVFSWIPPEVRQAMMRILQQNLTANGLGYISYNTYPGWKAGDIVRDAMLLHSHGFDTDADKLAGAKAMLSLLSDGIARSNPLAPSLRAAVAQLKRHSDYYISHEYLETFNNPCYLLEFEDMAAQHDLMHVGDAEPHVEMPLVYGANVQMAHSVVALGKPRVLRQQYLDFAVGRNFRKSLVVHRERAEQILHNPDTDRLADLFWAAHFTEEKPHEGAAAGTRSFRNQANRPLHSSDPQVLGVINALTAAWPRSLSFAELATTMEVADKESAMAACLEALQTLFRLNMLRYGLEPSFYDAVLGTQGAPADGKPALIPGAAKVLEFQQKSGFGIGLFNLWHESVNLALDAPQHYVFSFIDGRRSRNQLAILLRDGLQQGLVDDHQGNSRKGQRNLDPLAHRIVDRLLEQLNRVGLLLPRA